MATGCAFTTSAAAFAVKARVCDRVRQGVVRHCRCGGRKLSPDGRNANEVTSQALADMGGAATFTTVWSRSNAPAPAEPASALSMAMGGRGRKQGCNAVQFAIRGHFGIAEMTPGLGKHEGEYPSCRKGFLSPCRIRRARHRRSPLRLKTGFSTTSATFCCSGDSAA